MSPFEYQSIAFSPFRRILAVALILSIFIDDMAENIDAATEAGFTGIQYFTTEQLIEDLTQIGITEKEKVIL